MCPPTWNNQKLKQNRDSKPWEMETNKVSPVMSWLTALRPDPGTRRGNIEPRGLYKLMRQSWTSKETKAVRIHRTGYQKKSTQRTLKNCRGSPQIFSKEPTGACGWGKYPRLRKEPTRYFRGPRSHTGSGKTLSPPSHTGKPVIYGTLDKVLRKVFPWLWGIICLEQGTVSDPPNIP